MNKSSTSVGVLLSRIVSQWFAAQIIDFTASGKSFFAAAPAAASIYTDAKFYNGAFVRSFVRHTHISRIRFFSKLRFCTRVIGGM